MAIVCEICGESFDSLNTDDVSAGDQFVDHLAEDHDTDLTKGLWRRDQS